MNTNNRFTYFVTQSFVAALTATLLSVDPALSQESDTSRPNIVFIYADDLDADEISCTADQTTTWATLSGAKQVLGNAFKAGSPKVHTPNIDSLAKEGVLFSRFYVNATVCTSSRYCLLTGRYASRGRENFTRTSAGTHLTLGWNPAILRDETSLPKELQRLGYRTGIIGKWHNLPHKGVAMPGIKGDQRKANAQSEEVEKFQAKLKEQYRVGIEYLSDSFGWDVVDRMEWGNSIVNLDWQCEGALTFIEESRDQPFFLYCALPVPHGQYALDYNDISTYDPLVTSNGLLHEPVQVLPPNKDVYRRVKEAGVPKVNAMATRMDDYVGALLGKLDELGLRENTLVVFTSDHGSRGKNSCYEGGAKVPLIAAWPAKIKPGTTSDTLCGNVDCAATLIELAGGTPPVDIARDGLSFAAQLLGRPEPSDWRKSMLIEAGKSKAIVTRNWKYLANRVPAEIEKKMNERPRQVFWSGVDHHNYGTEKMYPAFWDADQLYDLSEDLYEQTNLAQDPAHAAILERLQKQLRASVSDLPFAFGEFTSK